MTVSTIEIIILSLLLLFICIIYYISMRRLGVVIGKLRDANNSLIHSSDDEVKAANKLIEKLVADLNRASDELKISKDRIESIENKIEDDFGVQVRNVQTVIKADFDKVEMAVMMSGIFKLIPLCKTLEDIEFYIALIKKIQGLMDKMDDPKGDASNGV